MLEIAKPQDAEAIAHVIQTSIKACVADHHNDPQVIQDCLSNKTADNLKAWLQHKYAVSVKQDDQVIGFLLLSPKGELLLNYLLPSHFHQDLGKQMLKSAIDHAKAENIAQIYLESTKTAKDFYQRNGFVITDEVVENGEVMAFNMVLDLAKIG